MIPFRSQPPRSLTSAEIAALPPGLVATVAIDEVKLIGRHHPVSRLAQMIGRGAQIVVRGKRIFWPRLVADFSHHPQQMALLAHELVHVWQYANGMTLWRYMLRERGHYRYVLDGRPFTRYGYEQQAAMVEDWMYLRAGHAARWSETVDLRQLQATVPFL